MTNILKLKIQSLKIKIICISKYYQKKGLKIERKNLLKNSVTNDISINKGTKSHQEKKI